MNLEDVEGLDQILSQPTNTLDTSYTIGEIMQQQSTTTGINSGSGGAINNSITGSQNMSHIAEQSSRHLIIAGLPKTTAAYVHSMAHQCGIFLFSISQNCFTMNSTILQ